MGAKVYIGMYKPFDGFEQRASLELSSNRSYTAVDTLAIMLYLLVDMEIV